MKTGLFNLPTTEWLCKMVVQKICFSTWLVATLLTFDSCKRVYGFFFLLKRLPSTSTALTGACPPFSPAPSRDPPVQPS